MSYVIVAWGVSVSLQASRLRASRDTCLQGLTHFLLLLLLMSFRAFEVLEDNPRVSKLLY